MYPKLRNYFTASVLLKKTLSSTPKLTCLSPVVQVPDIQVSPIIRNQTIVLRDIINTWLYWLHITPNVFSYLGFYGRITKIPSNLLFSTLLTALSW